MKDRFVIEASHNGKKDWQRIGTHFRLTTASVLAVEAVRGGAWRFARAVDQLNPDHIYKVRRP